MILISTNQSSLSWIWMILGNYNNFAAITLILTWTSQLFYVKTDLNKSKKCLKRWPLRPLSRSNRSNTQMRVNASKRKIISESRKIISICMKNRRHGLTAQCLRLVFSFKNMKHNFLLRFQCYIKEN